MPTNLLICCATAGALFAAILMNWAVRKNKQFKREGRDVERALTGLPIFISLSMLGAALGAVEWDRNHDFANQAAGAVMLGILVGALTADFGGFGFGDGDDDAGLDSDDGGGDGGE